MFAIQEINVRYLNFKETLSNNFFQLINEIDSNILKRFILKSLIYLTNANFFITKSLEFRIYFKFFEKLIYILI